MTADNPTPKDFYVQQYKQQFIDLYDRNSEEFRKDLDRLLTMAYAAGATAEKYGIIERFNKGEIMFSVDSDSLSEARFQKIITSRIADTVRRML